MSEKPTSMKNIAAALAPFGWTCGTDFEKRYHEDAWVFNLANAVGHLRAELVRVETENEKLREAISRFCSRSPHCDAGLPKEDTPT
jgi:hypothetical protein